MTQVLQQFECSVEEIGTDSIFVLLYDLTNTDNPQETAEIPLEKFDENFRANLKEGLVFYWNIGYDTKDSGQIVRVSEFSLTLDRFLHG